MFHLRRPWHGARRHVRKRSSSRRRPSVTGRRKSTGSVQRQRAKQRADRHKNGQHGQPENGDSNLGQRGRRGRETGGSRGPREGTSATPQTANDEPHERAIRQWIEAPNPHRDRAPHGQRCEPTERRYAACESRWDTPPRSASNQTGLRSRSSTNESSWQARESPRRGPSTRPAERKQSSARTCYRSVRTILQSTSGHRIWGASCDKPPSDSTPKR